MSAVKSLLVSVVSWCGSSPARVSLVTMEPLARTFEVCTVTYCILLCGKKGEDGYIMYNKYLDVMYFFYAKGVSGAKV